MSSTAREDMLSLIDRSGVVNALRFWMEEGATTTRRRPDGTRTTPESDREGFIRLLRTLPLRVYDMISEMVGEKPEKVTNPGVPDNSPQDKNYHSYLSNEAWHYKDYMDRRSYEDMHGITGTGFRHNTFRQLPDYRARPVEDFPHANESNPNPNQGDYHAEFGPYEAPRHKSVDADKEIEEDQKKPGELVGYSVGPASSRRRWYKPWVGPVTVTKAAHERPKTYYEYTSELTPEGEVIKKWEDWKEEQEQENYYNQELRLNSLGMRTIRRADKDMLRENKSQARPYKVHPLQMAEPPPRPSWNRVPPIFENRDYDEEHWWRSSTYAYLGPDYATLSVPSRYSSGPVLEKKFGEVRAARGADGRGYVRRLQDGWLNPIGPSGTEFGRPWDDPEFWGVQYELYGRGWFGDAKEMADHGRAASRDWFNPVQQVNIGDLGTCHVTSAEKWLCGDDRAIATGYYPHTVYHSWGPRGYTAAQCRPLSPERRVDSQQEAINRAALSAMEVAGYPGWET